jgi:hypothetical protein
MYLEEERREAEREGGREGGRARPVFDEVQDADGRGVSLK